MKPIVESQILANLPLVEGSEVFQKWKDPPVQPILFHYVFNLTNKEAFLQGKEKAKLQELGPYSYKQDMKKANVKLSPDGETVDYMQSRAYFFAPELSNGKEDDLIIVPNIPLFGAFKKLQPQPQFAKTIFLTLLSSYSDIAIDVEPFVTTTVGEFLWGYPSVLMSLDRAQSPKCQEEEWGDFDDDFDLESFDDEATTSKKEPTKALDKINCDIVPGNLAHFGLYIGRNNSVLDLRTIKTG